MMCGACGNDVASGWSLGPCRTPTCLAARLLLDIHGGADARGLRRRCGAAGPICADECPGGVGNACSLHGDCIIPKGSKPYCICYAGYSGADCSFECPGGALNPCTGQVRHPPSLHCTLSRRPGRYRCSAERPCLLVGACACRQAAQPAAGIGPI